MLNRNIVHTQISDTIKNSHSIKNQLPLRHYSNMTFKFFIQHLDVLKVLY
jgi:hypothetical protein